MIIVPRRSASAPLPPFCSFLAKEGARCVRFRYGPCAYQQPLPRPSPRSRRPSSPLALGRSGRSVRQLAAPPHSRGGLGNVSSLRQNPNPHPSPRSRPSAHAPRFRFGAWSAGQLAAPPRSRGGLLITSSPTIQHIYCVSAPLHGRLFAFSLATVRPLPRCASAWNGRTLTKRFSGYAYPEKRP